jgi:hypothetical protein
METPEEFSVASLTILKAAWFKSSRLSFSWAASWFHVLERSCLPCLQFTPICPALNPCGKANCITTNMREAISPLNPFFALAAISLCR